MGVTGGVTDAEQDKSPISTEHITTLSPPDFHSAPADTATATTDAGRRKGRAQSESESEDPQEGTSWLDSSLPAT